MRFLRATSRWIDALNERVGRGVAWLSLLMVLLTTYDVIMRFVFRISYVFIQELEWHLFAIIFLMAAGYTLRHEAHVRVDIFYARMSPRRRAWIDFIGGFVFLFPTCVLIILTSQTFVVSSFAVLEGSPNPGGVPARFFLKAAIPAGFILVALQGISQTIKSLLKLCGKEGEG